VRSSRELLFIKLRERWHRLMTSPSTLTSWRSWNCAGTPSWPVRNLLRSPGLERHSQRQGSGSGQEGQEVALRQPPPPLASIAPRGGDDWTVNRLGKRIVRVF
jgi:hypothetical protein